MATHVESSESERNIFRCSEENLVSFHCHSSHNRMPREDFTLKAWHLPECAFTGGIIVVRGECGVNGAFSCVYLSRTRVGIVFAL